MITINGRVFENTYSSAQWATANPVLLNRVLGFDTTVKSFKMGDGVTHWLDLPFYCLVVYDVGTGILIAGNTFSLDEDYTDSLYPKLAGSYIDPSWITSLDYSKLTGAPTDLSDFANDVNFINQAGARAAVSAVGSLSYNPTTGVFSYTQPVNVSVFTNDSNYLNQAGARAALSAGGSLSYNATTGVFSYTQPVNVSAFTNDAGYLTTSAGDARYPQLSAVYVNPAFIASLPWSKITMPPTTLVGYGITDPIVLTSGAYSNPSWLTALAWSKITSTPTTIAGYGITDFNALGDARWILASGETRGIQTSNNITTSSGALVGSLIVSTANNATIILQNRSFTSAIFGVNAATGGINISSGSYKAFGINPTISESGTAGYQALFISPFESTTGSGAKLLIDAGTNSAASGGGTHTSKFTVDNTGAITASSLSFLKKGSITLVAGVGIATVAGISASSSATVSLNSIGGTVTTTWQYKVVCTTNTVTITAITNAGTTNTADTSVLLYIAIN